MKTIEGLFQNFMTFNFGKGVTIDEIRSNIRTFGKRMAIAVWSIESCEPWLFDIYLTNETWAQIELTTIRTKSGRDLIVVHGPSFEEIVAIMRFCS